jgi:hypothetical protein
MYKDIAKKKKWFAANKERLKQYYKRDYEKNREARIKKSADWRKNNPEKYREQYERSNALGAFQHYKFIRSNKGRFYSLRRQAAKRSLEVRLDIATYSTLIQSRCHYCDGVLNETGSGLDRVDNTKGYSVDNVVPCCKNCNVMKNSFLTYDEMLVVMKALKEYRNGPSTKR